ncbi:MAG: lytic transglycosylase domain-containing protein [Rhodobacteraceae bacterium]|nr:lytic transglycosylase domain-containing protein [Paracoccaceae bacterium]
MPASGQDVTSPYPSFTFKRIKAPKSDGSRRITVQIDPAEQAARLASTVALLDHPVPDKKDWTERVPANRAISDTGLPATAPGSYSWYWDMVSPKIGDSSGRFSLALSALAQGPGGKNVAAPRLQSLQDIAAVHGQDILAATVGTRVSPALVVAVISVESAGRADAVSPAGAKGLMQLISATAARFDVDDRADPVQNIKGGVAYLDWLMREFNDDPLMAIAAYNAGENAVKGAGGVPAYAETRDYVPKVLAAWAVARGLCVTPPELVSDGCVFAVKG